MASIVKTKNSMPTSPPVTSTPKTANKLDAYAASDTLNFPDFPDYLDMHSSLYFT